MINQLISVTEEKNESIRRAIASKLGQAYEQVVRELTNASAPLKTVHLSTQVRGERKGRE